MASSSFTAMVCEAGGSRVLAAWKVEVLSLFLASSLVCYRISEGTLGSFWARFWRCSVLQGHCVSPAGRVRFQPREEEQQQQQEQQEGSMSHCRNSGIKIGRKP